MTARKTKPLDDRAWMILRSAARLHRLCALKAPQLFIESERILLARRLASFPADAVSIAQIEANEAEIAQDEATFLRDHGYYDPKPGEGLPGTAQVQAGPGNPAE